LRDILTVLASLVILVLAAAVAAPPLINWEARRDVIDQAISRAAGTQARTEGRIGVRLLPSPRIRLDRLHLGPQSAEAPSLSADFVWSEVELMPLLRGEVRFTETRIGRAEIRIPVAGGRWTIPTEGFGSGRSRDWAFENLTVAQLLVTTQVPATGRTDQLYAENVAIEAQTLAGPWRVEGVTAGVPFRVATSSLAPDRTMQVKLSGGGDVFPRFDIDAKVALEEGGAAAPAISGKARILFGPPAQVAAAGIPIPVAVDTSFRSSGAVVELDPLSIEAGEGGASLRLTGAGSIRTDEPRISLKLEGRRLDADSFVLSSSGRDFASRLREWSLPPIVVPIDLDLSINSVGLAQEELSNFVLRGSILRGHASVDRIEFVAPGETRVTLQGEAGLTTQGGANGRIAVASTASDRLGRYLERLSIRSPFFKVFDGRPFEAASDFLLDLPLVSFPNFRVKAGDAVVTGNAKFTAPEGGNRGRLEAQVGVRDLNLDQLPQVSSVFDATQNLDVGFILDARDVRAGNRRGAGRISARILSDGPALLVESLDIVDLAGANARVSGRIAPDGSGRIAGKVTAQRAAPLVDLLGSVWIGGVSKFVPYFLREGGLNVDVVTERATPEPGSSELRLRTTVKGTAAGGAFDGEAMTVDGATDTLRVRVATDNTGLWVNRPDAAPLRRPSAVNLRGTRVGSGQFNVTMDGDVGGVRVTTNRPFAIGSDDEVVDSGEAELKTADLTPFLVLLGDGAGVEPPLPAEVRVTLGRERDASLLTISGRFGEGAARARIAARSRSDLSGEITLDRLSLPWLLTSLALNTPPDARSTSLWSPARFGQTGRLITGGQAQVRVSRLDLGRGLMGENASFVLGITPEGVAIRDLRAGLGGGQVAGQLNVSRQGGLATLNGEGSIREVPLAAITGASSIAARLSGTLKFGTSAETFAGLVANLGGAGELRLTNLVLPDADPAGIERALKRLLADDDPLAVQRAEAVISDELDRAPFRAAAVVTPVAVIGGALRLSPFVADTGAGSWQGVVAYDFKTLSFDARGSLSANAVPKGWTGSPPSIGLTWRGPFMRPTRDIDVGGLRNGLAAIVLQRELEKVESFELDANERLRRQQRRDMDRQRERDRLAAEEAARQARLRAEAERARQEAEQRARADAERARLDLEQRARAEVERRAAPEIPVPSSLPALGPPIDIRPAPQIQTPGG
jgi:hypothetical protein